MNEKPLHQRPWEKVMAATRKVKSAGGENYGNEPETYGVPKKKLGRPRKNAARVIEERPIVMDPAAFGITGENAPRVKRKYTKRVDKINAEVESQGEKTGSRLEGRDDRGCGAGHTVMATVTLTGPWEEISKILQRSR